MWCWFRWMAFAGTMRGAMARRTCWRWARRACGLRKGCCRAILRLRFPTTSRIVTGLYPEHHGLVANNFYDESKQARYSMSDSKAVSDGSWYSGVRCGAWRRARGCALRASLAGIRSRDRRPPAVMVRDLRHKDASNSEVEQARIDDAVALLRLPADQRPHLIAIYFSEPDHEGHEFGPDAAADKGSGAENGRPHRQAEGCAGCKRSCRLTWWS